MNNALLKLPRQTFGQILRQEREKQGLSHRDIAVRCSVDKETAKAWERDAAVPDRLELKKLFGSMQRLRHYVALLPHELSNQVHNDARRDGDPLPTQLAPIAPPSEPAPTTFGAALRRARLHEGMDQHELAELIGVTQPAISTWETGGTTPILDHFEKLVGLFEELADFPPDNIRDIGKPVGNRFGNSTPASSPSLKEEPMPAPVKLIPSDPADASNVVLDKNALVRMIRLVNSLKNGPQASEIVDFLAEAQDAGMTAKDMLDVFGA